MNLFKSFFLKNLTCYTASMRPLRPVTQAEENFNKKYFLKEFIKRIF